MEQGHVEPSLVQAMLVDMFPNLPEDVVIAQCQPYLESGSVDAIVDDLMAYSFSYEEEAGREITIQPDADDGGTDESSYNSSEDLEEMNDELALIEMFPDFDVGRLHRIYETVQCDFEQAVTILVSLSDDDLSTYPEDVAILSDLCPLIPVSVLHGALVERNFLIDDVIRDIFCDSNDTEQPFAQNKLNMADHLKMTAFKRMFPQASEDVVVEVMMSENNLYRHSFESLQDIFGPPVVIEHTLRAQIMQDNIRQQQHRNQQLQQQQQQQQQHLLTQQLQQSQSSSHEEAGFSLSMLARLDRLYRGQLEHITDASIREIEFKITSLSEQRADLRRRAQNAMGDRQVFSGQMLYQKARDLDDRIELAREQLMVSVFNRNNPKAYDLKTIDLHGIYVREARRLVFDFICRVKARFCGVTRQISIIVGIGRHSTTTFSPKLRPAIVHLLKYLKLQFEVRNGEIIVLIK